MPAAVNMSPEDLQRILEAVISKVQQLNPLEQRAYDEMVAKERRRDLLAVEVGRAEMAAQRAKREGCSHKRYNATSGKLSGQSAPKDAVGNTEWCTGGQAYQNGLAMIFCSRCHSDWWFKPTQDYYTFIMQNGLEGIQPPPDSESICIGCYEVKTNCKCAEISQEYVNAHPTVA